LTLVSYSLLQTLFG